MQNPIAYPQSASSRTKWILSLRGEKNPLDVYKPYAAILEEETSEQGEPVKTATLFLTNKECPYRCLMCDLWKNTLNERVPNGAIAEQIRYGLSQLSISPLDRPVSQIKLYNAGSFFDTQAIPFEDYPGIAEEVKGFARVIVEAHPALINDRCLRFRDLIDGQLEVAIGLETVHPDTLSKLNKRFDVEDFRRAAKFLKDHNISLRVFLLVRPPFMTEAEGVKWAKRSLDFAFESGASVCCLIPTRGGNGAMEALSASGDFESPRLKSIEEAQEYGLNLAKGRVFSDLWDIEKFYTCSCSPSRAKRLALLNRTQLNQSAVECADCTQDIS